MTVASILAIHSFILMSIIQLTYGVLRDTLGGIAFVCLLSFFPLIEIGSIKRIKEKLELKSILTMAVASMGIVILAFFAGIYVILNLTSSSLFTFMLLFEFYLFFCMLFFSTSLFYIYFKYRKEVGSIQVSKR